MVCLINNDLIPKVHPLAVPIFHVHLNHFANIKIPWRSNYMESLGLHFQQLLKKPENNHLWFSGSTGSQENSSVDAGGVGSPYLRKNHPLPLFLSPCCEGGGRGQCHAFTYEWNLAIQWNGWRFLTWQNLPTFGTLHARWLSLPPTRSCSQSCAEIEATAEFQVKQEHNWKCDRYTYLGHVSLTLAKIDSLQNGMANLIFSMSVKYFFIRLMDSM